MVLSIKQPLMLSLNELNSGATAAREVLMNLVELRKGLYGGRDFQTLKPVSWGPDVVQLEMLLKRRGLLDKFTGRYTEETEQAVRVFQGQVQLDANGLACKATIVALVVGMKTVAEVRAERGEA
ncbi:peptidoglycan-binding domain-containing protein [Pseudomonas sp. 21LCFQ010]|uniref:peptidoglycan-binding domain-containing protein n=1 Tax=Pseudomonas sp. 21LCFQ010 TaxID=2957506 RepID=UPI003454B25A